MTRGTIRKETLPNGITLLTEHMPHVRSVTLGVWLRRGSRHEPVSLNGASHFIEHLVFKGTETRSARDIALAVDSIGGQMDAFTSKEYTCFYAKVLDDHVSDAVDLLSDIVLRPLFDAKELERERQVIVEEIRMVEDAPEELIYDLFSTHFYPGHALGRPIQGTESTVRGLSRRRLLDYFRGIYVPENLLIVAAGNVRHAELARQVRKAFGRMKPGGRRLVRGKRPRPRRSSSSSTCSSGFPPSPRGTPAGTRCSCSTRCSAGRCPRVSSRRCAKSGGWPTACTPPSTPSRTPAS
jgi:predicted Zn-dependent peptidase